MPNTDKNIDTTELEIDDDFLAELDLEDDDTPVEPISPEQELIAKQSLDAFNDAQTKAAKRARNAGE